MCRLPRALFGVVTLVCLIALAACGGQQPAQQQAPPPALQQAPAESAPPAATPPVETPAPAAPAPAQPKPAPVKAQPARQPAPAPVEQQAPAAPQPPPAPVVKTVVAGTVIPIQFVDALSSKTSKVGDAFTARVVADVAQDGVVVIPAGSTVTGEVTEAQDLKAIGGTAKLGLSFSRLDLPSGRTTPIQASFAEQGKSETKKDAATIGGAAAGGALLGQVIGGGSRAKRALIGAAVGAAAGTVIASQTKGQEVEIPAGTELQIQLTQPTEVTITK